jgi:hypothetical protein
MFDDFMVIRASIKLVAAHLNLGDTHLVRRPTKLEFHRGNVPHANEAVVTSG